MINLESVCVDLYMRLRRSYKTGSFYGWSGALIVLGKPALLNQKGKDGVDRISYLWNSDWKGGQY